MKDSIPANNLLHTFPETDVARSLQIPAPTLELDFRMSIKSNPKVLVGPGLWGQREWVAFVAGQWAGRWGKGLVLVRSNFVQRANFQLANHIMLGSDSPAVTTPKSLSKNSARVFAPHSPYKRRTIHRRTSW